MSLGFLFHGIKDHVQQETDDFAQTESKRLKGLFTRTPRTEKDFGKPSMRRAITTPKTDDVNERNT